MSQGSSSQLASNYFLVDYTTGEIRLRQSLMNDPDKRLSYSVSMIGKKEFLFTRPVLQATVSLKFCVPSDLGQ